MYQIYEMKFIKFDKQLLELKQNIFSLFVLQLLQVAFQENHWLKVNLTVKKKTTTDLWVALQIFETLKILICCRKLEENWTWREMKRRELEENCHVACF